MGGDYKIITMTTLKKIKASESFKELIPTEHAINEDYQNKMLVRAEEIREIIDEGGIDLAFYAGLTESNNSDAWNELRIHDLVVDPDAPDELTTEEWATYFDQHINIKKEMCLVCNPTNARYIQSDCLTCGGTGHLYEHNQPSTMKIFTEDTYYLPEEDKTQPVIIPIIALSIIIPTIIYLII